jgi:hypothetical protein
MEVFTMTQSNQQSAHAAADHPYSGQTLLGVSRRMQSRLSAWRQVLCCCPLDFQARLSRPDYKLKVQQRIQDTMDEALTGIHVTKEKSSVFTDPKMLDAFVYQRTYFAGHYKGVPSENLSSIW